MASANLVHWTELACLFNEQTGAESGSTVRGFIWATRDRKLLCIWPATSKDTIDPFVLSLREAALWLYSELDFTSWSRTCKQCGAHPAELQHIFSLTDQSSLGRPHGGDLDLVVSKGKGESEGEVTSEVLMINACIIIGNIYVYLTTSEHI
ncbi:hypothetical protein EDC04DRAFT_2610525 [Pisolithus marmoratus]|nr:hypothetical protein EDC04DRAFT_2610525 [Pisolithus marmoratus]